MANIITISIGSKLNIKDNSLEVTITDSKKLIPFSEITILMIENLSCTITSHVIVKCSEFNVPIIFCDEKHSPFAISTSFNQYHRQLPRLKEQIE